MNLRRRRDPTSFGSSDRPINGREPLRHGRADGGQDARVEHVDGDRQRDRADPVLFEDLDDRLGIRADPPTGRRLRPLRGDDAAQADCAITGMVSSGSM